MRLRDAVALSASTRSPHTQAFDSWRPDAAAVVGFALVLAYVLPARLVINGLGAAGRPALVLGAGLLTWWCLAYLLSSAFIRGRQPLRTAVAIFALTFLASYTFALAGALPVAEVSGLDRSLLRFAGLVGFTLVICDGIRTRQRLEALLRTLIACGLFMGVIGSLQYLAGIDLTPNLRVPGLVLNGDLIGVAARAPGFSRVAGTAGHYIEFGVLMTLLVPIALHFGLYSKTRPRRAFYLTAVGFLTLCSFYSVSRSAVVSLVVAALFSVPGWPWRRKLNILALGVVFVLLVQVVQPGLLGTLRSLFRNIENDPSIEGRTNDYEVVAPLIADRFWFGRGPGTYSPERYVLLDNQWLSWLVTNGAVGVLGLAVLFVTATLMAKRVGRWARTPEDRNLGHALGASIISAGIISFTFDSFSFTTFAVTTFTLIGCAGALWRVTGGPVPTDRAGEVRRGIPA